MLMITIYGGGIAVIGPKQLGTWQHLYKHIDVNKEIKKLDNSGIFNKMTANGVFKTINKHLQNKNNEIENKLSLHLVD